MGQGVHRLGDATSGHGCWLPSQAIEASENVRVNGRGVVRQGDKILPHICPEIPETHPGVYIGSGTVRANGRPIQCVGSGVSCGDKALTGSDNVRIGG